MYKDLSDAQLKAEIAKCEYCEEKPCREACPANCSPADFIMAVKNFEDRDFERAASMILSANPLGGICGYTCPDYHCMKACVHKTFDKSVNIPAVQTAIIKRARQKLREPVFSVSGNEKEKNINKKILITGSGPAGLACSAVLAQKGYQVYIFDKDKKPGGMCNLIPSFRLPKDMLKADLDFVKELGYIKFKNAIDYKNIKKDDLLKYDAVVFATGLNKASIPAVKGKEFIVKWDDFLKNAKDYALKDKRIAIIGAGAIATDVCLTAYKLNAEKVDIIALEKLSELPLTEKEFYDLTNSNAIIYQRTKIKEIYKNKSERFDIQCCNVHLQDKKKFNIKHLQEYVESDFILQGYDFVVSAIGSISDIKVKKKKNIFFAGDIINKATTVVEAVASGKNTALKVDAFLHNQKLPHFAKETKSYVSLSRELIKPVSLECDFFGRKISSPFILSAAPPTDGYEQVKKAYEAGWAGAILKTAFNDLDIHIPSEYMYLVNKDTYANCDNVSEHSLKRVCSEIKKLVNEFPEHLTIGSTGGAVTGDDINDKKSWQENTKLLEDCGAMGIEYSLSCPQGGDGTEGDIVSQNAELTAKIIDWVMEISNPDIPKLFKLTGAVTSINTILIAIKQVFDKYPDKKAGITLANSFPALLFRQNKDINKWDKATIVGLSGAGVAPISNLSLAKASELNMNISANGGAMDYKSASHFLAMGAKTVQFCTIVMKYGYGIIDELKDGLTYLLAEKRLNCTNDLIGIAKPKIITDFMDLSPVKKVSDVIDELCQHCGNCTRCPYLAIELNQEKTPRTDCKKCIGCSICVQKCFSGALFMRDRLDDELRED